MKTTRDIVIPAGTELREAPRRTLRFTDHVEAIEAGLVTES